MKHIINGCPIYLRGCSESELEALAASTKQRIERAQEELESVMGEVVRRSDNVHQLRFDLPPHHSYDGVPS